MKKIIMILFILFCFLVSCQRTITDQMIAEQLSTMEFSVSESMVKSSQVDIYDSGNRIVSKNHIINDNKLYFKIQKKNPKITGPGGLSMISYIDLKTGDSQIICQDPLCKHENNGECKYLGFEEVHFIDDGVFYSWNTNGVFSDLCKIDLKKDVITVIHKPESYISLTLGTDVKTGVFYFYEVEVLTVSDEKQVQYIYHLYSVNPADDQVEYIGVLNDTYADNIISALFIKDRQIFLIANGNLVKSNLLLTDMEEICALEGNNTINAYQWYYDKQKDELWFNISDHQANTGNIYVYTGEKVRKVNLPHENIYSFCLTDENIYYSTYNPIFYGISASSYYLQGNPENHKVYDYSGGKVYVTNRDYRVSSDLVYDCAGKYRICSSNQNYIVIDDCLCFDEVELIHEKINGVEYTYFSSADTVNKIRVNLTTGELKRIVFE